MHLRFVIGPSGSGKSYTSYQEILKRAQAEPGTRFLVIVPDQFTMHTQKVLCHLSPTGGILNVEVLSFGRLSHRIFEELGIEGLPRLDDTGKNLILRRLAIEHADELTVVGARMRRTGFIAEVKSLISEFAQYGNSPDRVLEMAKIGRMNGALSAKLKDLAVLYRAYQEEIRGKYITVEENIDILVKNAGRSALLRDSVILFDGFTGFTPIQETLIRELLLVSREVIVTLLGEKAEDLHDETRKENLFYLSARTYHRLERIAREIGCEIGEDVILSESGVSRFGKNPVLRHLSQNLFRTFACAPVSSKQAVELIRCANPKKETEAVATRILRLIRTQDYCYRDFAVITSGLDEYGHLLEEEFKRRGIPLFLDQNSSLLKHPLMVFLQSLLRIGTTDFSYDAVMSFLRTGYTPLSVDAIDRFDLFIRRYGIRGVRRYKKDFGRGLSPEDEIQKVRSFVYETALPFLEKEQSAREYTEKLYEVMVRLDLAGQLDARAKAFEEANDPVKAKVYSQVYRALIELFDQIYTLLPEKLALRDYLEVLKAGFAELHVGVIPQSVDQVTAGDLERTRLKPVKVLFVLGANDGLIPKKNAGGGLLSDMERTFLAENAMDLAPTTQEKSFEERIYLYMNMTQPTDRLIVSYALSGSDGKMRQPSYIVGVLKKLFTDLTVTDPEEEDPLFQLEGEAAREDLLATLLRDYAQGYLERDPQKTALLLALLCSDPKGEAHREKIFDAAFYSYAPADLSEEVAKKIYGRVLHTSVSRLERFAGCAYAHFLEFGCKLKQEKEYETNYADLGTIYHGVLEGFGAFLARSGYLWESFPEAEADAFIDEACDRLADEVGGGVFTDGERNRAALSRVKRILKTTVRSLSYQLAHDGFTPFRYEWKLKREGRVSFEGRIDRVDLAKEGDKVYAKVMDYKSSEHTFDLTQFYYGLDIQLATYMNVALSALKKEYPGKEVVPAGMYYYQIQDPVIKAEKAMDDATLEEEKRKEMRQQGLGNSASDCIGLLDRDLAANGTSTVIKARMAKNGSLDSRSQVAAPEEMERILSYALKKTDELGEQILSGCLSVDPYRSGSGENQRCACTYCDYAAICGFDQKLGYTYRELEKKTMDDIMTES